MLIELQPAFVLHTRPYRETSLLVECLTRDHGRLGVVARGVRGARARASRADLEPFQALSMNLSLGGELASLRGVEVHRTASRLQGDALLAGLYLNELLVRLCARQDPHPTIHDHYARTLERLRAGDAPGWTLRRFERDLLTGLGYGMQLLDEATHGTPVEALVWYRYTPDLGPQRCNPQTAHAVSGADLLALATDRCPDADGQRRLRAMMRQVLRFHLGGSDLRAWQVLRPGPSKAGQD